MGQRTYCYSCVKSGCGGREGPCTPALESGQLQTSDAHDTQMQMIAPCAVGAVCLLHCVVVHHRLTWTWLVVSSMVSDTRTDVSIKHSLLFHIACKLKYAFSDNLMVDAHANCEAWRCVFELEIMRVERL